MSTICYNLAEVVQQRKCDNNSDSSDQNRPYKTHLLETKLDILKHIDNGEGHGEIACLLGLSCSTMSITAKNIVKLMEHVKSAGNLQSIMVNPPECAD
jgi:DNA-binding NarL/FixJ family response regulator